MAMYREHDDRLRELLDQRTTAPHHGRIPSLTLTERSDSPSVYSRANFSPYPLDQDELEANTKAFDFKIPAQFQPARQDSMAFDRDNLDNLDLEDGMRSSYAFSQRHEIDEPEQVLPPEDEPEVVDDGDPDPRMSLLGPKIAFHSRAPWETGEDALLEEQEDSDSGHSKAPSIFGRGRQRGTKKGMRASPTHRSNSAVRPSEDSLASSLAPSSFPRPPHRGLESSASTGALGSLAKASISSSSFTAPQSKRARSGGRSFKASDASSTSQPPSSFNSAHSSPQPTSASSPTYFQYNVSSASPRHGASTPSSPADFASLDRLSVAPSMQTGVSDDSSGSWVEMQHPSHPYANPDLAGTFSSPVRGGLGQTVSRTDSITTLTDGPNKGRAPTPPPRPGHRKEISSPVSVKTSTLRTNDASLPPPIPSHESLRPSTPNAIAGWKDTVSPPVTLISLAEAQALARERSRSATTTAATAPPRPPFLQSESASSFRSQSPLGRMRVASESAAPAKAKQQSLPTPARNDSDDFEQREVAGGRTLKQKKSKNGFMRMFGGSKERERETPPAERSPQLLSPVTDGYFAPPSPVKTPKMVQRAGTPNGPQLTPPRLEDSFNSNLSASDLSSNTLDSTNTPPPRTPDPPKRTLADTSKRTLASLTIKAPEPRTGPKQMDARSAPPGTTDFPALKLRPVSTLFSAHFASHIVEEPRGLGKTIDEEDESDDTGTANSPMTPGFPGGGGDPAAVIQALQEQIAASRRMWQRQLWELEGQVRDLKAEVEELRGGAGDDRCEACGRGGGGQASAADVLDARKKAGVSVMQRPRARTGDAASRFGAAI